MRLNSSLPLISVRDPNAKTSAKVGKAVYDILSKDQPMQTVGETVEAMSPAYLEELKDCVLKNQDRYESPFYVVVLGKKEMFALNAVRQWFIARQSCPLSTTLMNDYPNYFHEVYTFNKESGDCRLLWCLPAIWVHKEIMNHAETYHPQLVQWVFDHYAKTLGVLDQKA